MKTVLVNFLVISVVVTVLLLNTAIAAEISGTVESVDGSSVNVTTKSDLFPVTGDKLVVSTKIPGTDIVAEVGTGTVTKIEGTTIIAEIERASGRLEPGQLVSITSANPIRRPTISEIAKSDFSSNLRNSIPPAFVPADVVAKPHGGLSYIERLKGEWICIATTFEGEVSDQYINVRARFKGRKMTWRYPLPDGSIKEQECEFRIDESQKPIHFDWWSVNKPETVKLRLIEFAADDVMRWGTNISTRHRPKSFDDARYVFFMKRIRDKTEPSLAPQPMKKAADRVNLPKRRTTTFGMKLNLIPAGEFEMGSRKSRDAVRKDLGGRRTNTVYDQSSHKVTIARPFFMGVYEVTKGNYRRFVDATGYTKHRDNKNGGERYDADHSDGPTFVWVDDDAWRQTGFEQTEDHPVTNINWYDAVAFCEWLSREEGRTYRLPTETEWEYACRAGTDTYFHMDVDVQSLQDKSNGRVLRGWFNAKDQQNEQRRKRDYQRYLERLRQQGKEPPVPDLDSSGMSDWLISWRPRAQTEDWYDGYAFTAPVGQYSANAWGLHDMHGNVAELCRDVVPGKYESGQEYPNCRVVRGGSWWTDAIACRSASRYCIEPGDREPDIGFRVVLEVD